MNNVQIEGIDYSDSPDFCDAFIAYAEHADGTPFTEAELEAISPHDVYRQLEKELA